MTKAEFNQFHTILTAKQKELARAAGRREGIAIERTADTLDETTLPAERELTTRSLEQGSRLLRNVRAALDRIADGTYGACLECEEEISQKRLRAMPWATLCITCQERADGNQQRRFGSSQRFLMDAAA